MIAITSTPIKPATHAHVALFHSLSLFVTPTRGSIVDVPKRGSSSWALAFIGVGRLQQLGLRYTSRHRSSLVEGRVTTRQSCRGPLGEEFQFGGRLGRAERVGNRGQREQRRRRP